MTREETQGTREELGRNKDQGTRGNPGRTERSPGRPPLLRALTLAEPKLNPWRMAAMKLALSPALSDANPSFIILIFPRH